MGIALGVGVLLGMLLRGGGSLTTEPGASGIIINAKGAGRRAPRKKFRWARFVAANNARSTGFSLLFRQTQAVPPSVETQPRTAGEMPGG